MSGFVRAWSMECARGRSGGMKGVRLCVVPLGSGVGLVWGLEGELLRRPFWLVEDHWGEVCEDLVLGLEGAGGGSGVL